MGGRIARFLLYILSVGERAVGACSDGHDWHFAMCRQFCSSNGVGFATLMSR